MGSKAFPVLPVSNASLSEFVIIVAFQGMAKVILRPGFVPYGLVYWPQSGEFRTKGRPESEEYYGSVVTVPRSRLRNLADIGYDLNVYTYFLGTQSRVHVKAQGMVSLRIWGVLSEHWGSDEGVKVLMRSRGPIDGYGLTSVFT